MGKAKNSKSNKVKSTKIKKKRGKKQRARRKSKVDLFGERDANIESRLLSDWEGKDEFRLEKVSKRHTENLRSLPKPTNAKFKRLGFSSAKWNSVFLFFNFTPPNRPSDYQHTSIQDAKNLLDEGNNPADPTVSEFMCNYWNTISHGNWVFGIDTPRNSLGVPLIPTINVPVTGLEPNHWRLLIEDCIKANATAVWQAAGSLMKDNKRWIPSVVLIHRYWNLPSAYFGEVEITVNGQSYIVGDRTHITYYLDFVDLPGVPSNKVRKFWGTLCHEFAHNFLEFGDLYGPPGCTGYWDLLGANSPPGRMSEVSSQIKERIGWVNFKHVIKGLSYSQKKHTLRPYTKSGDCIKIIPDEVNNPKEYFMLEYRKSTGDETWRPDGALSDEGLLITHINERLGLPKSWLLRDAPYFDPEFADYSDKGGTLWTGHDALDGVLYPQNFNNSFTPISLPNSDFYGMRNSGLNITHIQIDKGQCEFFVEINGTSEVGWNVSDKDRCVAGKFTGESLTQGEEVFCRNDDTAALITNRQSQWFVVEKRNKWIGGWALGKDDYEVVGDFDGDGLDEIYIRSPEYAGVLKRGANAFNPLTIQHKWIKSPKVSVKATKIKVGNKMSDKAAARPDSWKLNSNNNELAGDFDGDGKDEIYIRSEKKAGVVKLISGNLELQYQQSKKIDGWSLGKKDSEYIGKFSQDEKDEILIRSPQHLGLLYWHKSQKRLRVKKIQHEKIDGWNLGKNDKMTIADFDGDGKDEIYIRSAKWAGVLKWVNNKFKLLWARKNNLKRLDGENQFSITLKSDDISYSGRFLPDRDGILHRTNDYLAVLTWENNQMLVRFHHRSANISGWKFSDNDNYVLGDFHRVGPDIADPTFDYITDGLTDVFVHNSWGTASIGVNPPLGRSELALTWVNKASILYSN